MKAIISFAWTTNPMTFETLEVDFPLVVERNEDGFVWIRGTEIEVEDIVSIDVKK